MLARLVQTDFVAVEGGTQYLSTLTIGSTLPVLGRLLNALAFRAIFTEAMGRAWLKHNIEEVGLLEHIIPRAQAEQRQLAVSP